jgi:hypothetical protein
MAKNPQRRTRYMLGAHLGGCDHKIFSIPFEIWSEFGGRIAAEDWLQTTPAEVLQQIVGDQLNLAEPAVDCLQLYIINFPVSDPVSISLTRKPVTTYTYEKTVSSLPFGGLPVGDPKQQPAAQEDDGEEEEEEEETPEEEPEQKTDPEPVEPAKTNGLTAGHLLAGSSKNIGVLKALVSAIHNDRPSILAIAKEIDVPTLKILATRYGLKDYREDSDDAAMMFFTALCSELDSFKEAIAEAEMAVPAPPA